MSIVVPAYNESRRIASTIQPLIDQGYDVVVVDDGSSDGTWRLLRRLPVHRLRHGINLGQGAALQTGTAYAVERGAQYVVHFDADGQHSPGDIPRMLEPLLAGEAEIVLGSRFLVAEHRRKIPPLKRWVLRGGVLVNGLLTRVWLSDAHNGFRAMTRKAASRIRLREPGYAHATEILMQIRAHRLPFVECATDISYSLAARLKGQPLWNAINIVIDVILRKVFA